MINYLPIRLFFISSALFFTTLLIRTQYSIFMGCLIVNLISALISIFTISKYTLLTLIIQKSSSIAFITCYQFQQSYHNQMLLIIYLISETTPTLLILASHKLYLNSQFALLTYATIMGVISQTELNEQLLIIMALMIYLFSTIPIHFSFHKIEQLEEQPSSIRQQIYQVPLSPSRDFQQPSGKVDSFSNELPFKQSIPGSIEISNRHFKHGSVEISNRHFKGSDLLSLQLVDQEKESDIIWKQRLKGIPVGILLINKNQKTITYKNKFLDNLLNRTLDIQENEQQNFLLTQLKFKIIDQGDDMKRSNYTQFLSLKQSKAFIDVPRTLTQQSMHTHKKINNSFRDIDIHHPTKMYTFTQVINKLQDGYFDNFLNESDHTLELFCKYQSLTVTVHLNMKLFYTPDSVEMSVILQDLTRQNKLQRIEEQDEFKNRMINSFSHELRTPLNSASLFFKSALLDENLHQVVREKYILPGLSSLMRQSHLINDIIDFSQINADQLKLSFNDFKLIDLIQELTALFNIEFKAKKIGLAFQIDYSVPDGIKTDYQRLLQILVNVIQNALKFSQSGYALIKITSKRENILGFEVQDEGIGIRNDRLNQIQTVLKDNHSNSQEWNGFGLIISQMLLLYLGPYQENELQIESPGQGMGTIVKFSIVNHVKFSVIRQHRKRSNSSPELKSLIGLFITVKSQTRSKLVLQLMDNNQTAINDFMKYQKDQTHLVSELNQQYYNGWYHNIDSMKKSSTYQQCRCNTILSVDDEIFNQVSLTCILQKLNFSVEIAFNGQQAIQMIEKKKECGQGCRKYLFILMDCQMPVLDGWQTTKILKNKFESRQLVPIPIIGFTAFTSKADIDLCKQVGMMEVLNKPLQVKKLTQLIEKIKEIV